MPFRATSIGCPRCGDLLTNSALVTGHPTRACPTCGGLLIAESALGALAALMAKLPAVTLPTVRDRSRAPLPCPDCARPMRPTLQLGIETDICNDHGVWLDSGELQKLLTAAS